MTFLASYLHVLLNRVLIIDHFQAIPEIRQNYEKLSAKQRDIVAMDPSDVFVCFIYEIGMIFDDQTS